MKAKKVLVADDQASSRELLRVLLEHALNEKACKVYEASDGFEAVAIARRTLPDVIFLDLDLPRLDAYAVVREMRQDPRLKTRPIVAMMGNAHDDSPDHLQEAGFSGYITKPVFLRAFTAHLPQFLAAPQGR